MQRRSKPLSADWWCEKVRSDGRSAESGGAKKGVGLDRFGPTRLITHTSISPQTSAAAELCLRGPSEVVAAASALDR
ncbi:unnamed protein product [Parajaminaea phylloscopi]